MGILHPIAQCQNEDWIPNPKLFGDTIDVHIFEKDPAIFINGNLDILVDDEGYIWISSYGNGLLRMDVNNPISFKQNVPEGYNFDQLNVRKMYKYYDELYFATDRGFLTYSPEKETFHRYGKNDLAKLPPYESDVHCLTFLSQDTVLLGGKHGLTLFDIKSDSIIEHLWDVDPPKDGSSTHNFVQQIKVDPSDSKVIWAVGRKGLFRLDRNTWERKYFTIADGLNNDLKHSHMIDFEIIGDHIYVVYLGKQKNSFIKGNQIAKFNKKTEEWKIILDLLPKDKYGATHVAEIQTLQRYGKYLFLAARGFGAQLIDTETDSLIQTYLRHPNFKIPNTWKDPNRLLDNYAVTFHTAIIDNNGYLWALNNREVIIKSKEPFFINQSKEPVQNLKLNNLFVNGIKHRKQNFEDSSQKATYLLNERERDLAFEVAIINPIYENVVYEYKYNSEKWKPILENGLVQISNLSPGFNSVKVKALHEERIINQQEYSFYTTPRLHERWWFIVGLLALITFVIYKFYELTVNKIKDEEKIKTEFNRQIAEMEMEVLKAQMNPHFLFNSLNSIKHYSINKSKRETSQYITTFSHLLRQILQNSNAKVVSLAQELKAIELYVRVERLRFENEFEYIVDLDTQRNEDTIFVPPMILQPFIENAIWHGLMLKEGVGKIIVTIDVKEHEVICEITDNGIGRVAAGKISAAKSEYSKQSLGTKITANRLKLAEKIYGKKSSFYITDLYDKNGSPSGTRVKVHLPRIYRTKENEL